MSIEFYPLSGYEEHPYGTHLALVGTGDVMDKIQATIDAFRALCYASVDVDSGTRLSERLAQETYYADDDPECETPLYRMVVQYLQDEDDINNDIVDVWTALEVTDRPQGWPSVAEDKASLDAIFSALGPS